MEVKVLCEKLLAYIMIVNTIRVNFNLLPINCKQTKWNTAQSNMDSVLP